MENKASLLTQRSILCALPSSALTVCSAVIICGGVRHKKMDDLHFLPTSNNIRLRATAGPMATNSGCRRLGGGQVHKVCDKWYGRPTSNIIEFYKMDYTAYITSSMECNWRDKFVYSTAQNVGHDNVYGIKVRHCIYDMKKL